MKKIVIFMLISYCLVLTSCYRSVPAGYRGIKVYMLGTRKGVETKQLGVGAYWIGPNQKLYKFPVFQQNYVWKDETKTGGADNSITFQSKEGLDVDGDFGISYSIVPDSVSALFQKYRRGIDEITNIFLRNMVRDALNITASRMPIESIYGIHKRDLLDSAYVHVAKQTAQYGIVIDRIYTIGEFRLPPVIEAAINAKLEANQKAMQTQNEVKAVEAEANKKIARSKGEAESQVIAATAEANVTRLSAEAEADALRARAKAEAEAITIKAKAEAEAKRIMADAEAEAMRKQGVVLTKDLLQYFMIQKWTGAVPQVSGQSTPFINMGAK